MPVAGMAEQMQGAGTTFKFPEQFTSYCKTHPNATGCAPWLDDIDWSGGFRGTQRFENFWDEPYVFVVVMDRLGYWTYRPMNDGRLNICSTE